MENTHTYYVNKNNGIVLCCLVTLTDDCELLTVVLQDNDIAGIFKFTTIHDRFYFNNIYGDEVINEQTAEQLNKLVMESAGV